MTPIRFAFGLHLHQPVGNFDHVFAQHVEDVYRPLLDALADREFLPVVLHLSGPLLEWLELHEPSYLDRLGRLVADGRVEILLAGFYEPVLAVLPRPDRIEQIRWMHDAVRHRFGVDAKGLWLTERVWEPELAADLADAGVRYALVDDRHFLTTGFAAEQLHAPFWTESDGKRVALFPIDERLRYLIPFRPPEETADYLRELRGAGHGLAVLADDGEKFGGWPGTKEWVYGKGWLDRFMATIGGLVESGEVVLSRLDQALDAVPSGGLAYLPTASYREMESWSLPPDAALRLARLEQDLGEKRVAGPDGALLRGAHWRNFLVKYPESNRMHKKMMALSALARDRGDTPAVRRAIGRAQCNDAYWHGVFGGLYLPHLRDAIWRNLADAEAKLRQGEQIAWEVAGPGRRRQRRDLDPFLDVLRAGEPRAGRRGRGVHGVRDRHQLRQHLDPAPGGVPRPGARARRRAVRRAGRRHGEHPRHRGRTPARRPPASRRRRSRAVRGPHPAAGRGSGGIRRRRLLGDPLLVAGALRGSGEARQGRGRGRLPSPARGPAGSRSCCVSRRTAVSRSSGNGTWAWRKRPTCSPPSCRWRRPCGSTAPRRPRNGSTSSRPSPSPRAGSSARARVTP